MVTSLRKAFTVTLSFVLFSTDKKFTSSHLFSILSIASGIGLNIYGKNKNKGKKPSPEDKQKEAYANPTETPLNNDIGAVEEPENIPQSDSD